MYDYSVLNADCREALQELPSSSVHCCVTSPPYYGLRDYGVDGQTGTEDTLEGFVSTLVSVFAEVHRVLRDDGTLWLNLGDGYAKNKRDGAKPKDLLGVPWRVAFALRDFGWYLRSEVIWHKPNAVPESVKDRCTKSHETLFLLTKSPKYQYDYAAIMEPAKWERWGDQTEKKTHPGAAGHLGGKTVGQLPVRDKKNKRSVWSIPTRGYSGAHFAVFPERLVEPCILAGCPLGGVVLDPFAGAGTSGVVALRHARKFIGIEINPEYCEMANARLTQVMASLPEAADGFQCA